MFRINYFTLIFLKNQKEVNIIKAEITLLLLLVISFTGVVADENMSISNNANDSLIDLDTDIVEEKRDSPGFEAVLALAGLGAVAYVVVRQKED